MCKNLIAFLFFSLILLSKNAFCCTLTSNEQTKIINSRLEKEIKVELDKILLEPYEFKINVSGIPFQDIVTDETTLPKLEIQNQSTGFQRNSIKRVSIKNSKGIILKTYPINVQTLVYSNVLTAKNIIGFNEEITANNTQIERKEISNYLNKTVSKISPNTVSKRNYQKGSVILADSIKEKSAVSKDSIVDIIFLSDNGLKIKIQGKALKEGSIGDNILVRSNKYNKIYNARVSSSNEVLVRI